VVHRNRTTTLFPSGGKKGRERKSALAFFSTAETKGREKGKAFVLAGADQSVSASHYVEKKKRKSLRRKGEKKKGGTPSIS